MLFNSVLFAASVLVAVVSAQVPQALSEAFDTTITLGVFFEGKKLTDGGQVAAGGENPILIIPFHSD